MISDFSHYPMESFLGAQNVALIANGAIHNYPLINSLIRSYSSFVAVDGGLHHCHQMGILPNLIIGDFDSITPELLLSYKNVPQERFSRDKDETDLELAIKAVLSSSIKKIGIFGALEKRMDHALVNLHLMRRFPNEIVIETESETLFTLTGKKRISCQPDQVVSLIPLETAKGVTTQGLKWELKHAVLDKFFISISNVCLNTYFDIDILEGDLICSLLRG